MIDLFKVEESSGGCGGELSKVLIIGRCLLLGVLTYLNMYLNSRGKIIKIAIKLTNKISICCNS
jgi:hypothetical protein